MSSITNWFEVYSPNVASAVSFYQDVFGWGTESMPMGEGQEYIMLSGNTGPFSGIMDLTTPGMEHIPPHWGLYFHTPNCQATIDKVAELGGTLVYGPMDIPGIGIVAGFKDTLGAHFNVHQPAADKPDMSGSPVNWVEHMGPDRPAAVEFYKALFGWGSMDMDMGEGVGIYSMFLDGETPSAGCMQVGAEAGPPAWMIYLHAENIGETLEKVAAAGGTVIQPSMDIGQFGHIAIVQDAGGAFVGLHQPPVMASV